MPIALHVNLMEKRKATNQLKLNKCDIAHIYINQKQNSILKLSSNRSPNIFTLVQKAKKGHTKRFNSKDKSRLCRDFAGYFILK